MSFKTYRVTPLAADTWLLTQPEPVRFSGPRGLIARHLRSPRPAESERWSLDDRDWLRLIHPNDAGDVRRWLVFEQTDSDALRLSRLHRINGLVSRGQTELLLTLGPLETNTPATRLIVTTPPGARTWCEELALDGAPDRPDAPWSWCERALHIGATILG